MWRAVLAVSSRWIRNDQEPAWAFSIGCTPPATSLAPDGTGRPARSELRDRKAGQTVSWIESDVDPSRGGASEDLHMPPPAAERAFNQLTVWPSFRSLNSRSRRPLRFRPAPKLWRGVQPDLKTPTLVSWSFRIQRELTANTALTIGLCRIPRIS